MTKKIAVFMMGLLAFSGLGLGFASAGGNQYGAGTPSGFGLNPSYTQGVNGIAGAGTNQGDWLMNVFKTAINWILGILGLITFVLLLWGGFNMVTAAGNEEKFGMGQKILKHAGIWLGFIAVSWLLVSMIFWLIGTFTSGA